MLACAVFGAKKKKWRGKRELQTKVQAGPTGSYTILPGEGGKWQNNTRNIFVQGDSTHILKNRRSGGGGSSDKEENSGR